MTAEPNWTCPDCGKRTFAVIHSCRLASLGAAVTAEEPIASVALDEAEGGAHTAKEPRAEVAVRNPRDGKAHPVGFRSPVCARKALLLTERVPVDTLDPADLCQRCWPTPKETT